MWKGNDTVIECGHNHPLQFSVLLWSIFRRRELLLLLRTGLQSANVRHFESLRLEILQDCCVSIRPMDHHRCFSQSGQQVVSVQLNTKYRLPCSHRSQLKRRTIPSRPFRHGRAREWEGSRFQRGIQPIRCRSIRASFFRWPKLKKCRYGQFVFLVMAERS